MNTKPMPLRPTEKMLHVMVSAIFGKLTVHGIHLAFSVQKDIAQDVYLAARTSYTPVATDEDIERVAGAIDPGCFHKNSDGKFVQGEGWRDIARNNAKAALKAMGYTVKEGVE